MQVIKKSTQKAETMRNKLLSHITRIPLDEPTALSGTKSTVTTPKRANIKRRDCLYFSLSKTNKVTLSNPSKNFLAKISCHYH